MRLTISLIILLATASLASAAGPIYAVPHPHLDSTTVPDLVPALLVCSAGAARRSDPPGRLRLRRLAVSAWLRYSGSGSPALCEARRLRVASTLTQTLAWCLVVAGSRRVSYPAR